MHLRARTPTAECCTRREIGHVDVEGKLSRCAMEAADEIKEGGTKVMPTTTPDPPEIGGVEGMGTGKGKPSQSASTVARKAIWRASAGRSAPIRIKPSSDIPTKESGSDRTTLKDPKKPEKGLPS